MYKRQFYDRLSLQNYIEFMEVLIMNKKYFCCFESMNNDFDSEAVSYTHLDVYKRQVPRHTDILYLPLGFNVKRL